MASDGFQTGIDEVCSHAVARLKGNVQLVVVLHPVSFVAELDVEDPSSPFPHVQGDPVRSFDQLRLDLIKIGLQLRLVAPVQKMNLSDLFCGDHLGFKTSPLTPELCSQRGSGHDRAFLNCHRNGIGTIVDDEVRSYGIGDIKIADGVLDEFVVQLLEFQILIQILAQNPLALFWVLKEIGGQPVDLFFFGEFGESFYRF